MGGGRAAVHLDRLRRSEDKALLPPAGHGPIPRRPPLPRSNCVLHRGDAAALQTAAENGDAAADGLGRGWHGGEPQDRRHAARQDWGRHVCCRRVSVRGQGVHRIPQARVRLHRADTLPGAQRVGFPVPPFAPAARQGVGLVCIGSHKPKFDLIARIHTRRPKSRASIRPSRAWPPPTPPSSPAMTTVSQVRPARLGAPASEDQHLVHLPSCNG
mmetsp:Transcript_31742/g.77886  ORF Transcript_31742/g.77886 Transcript_31742/m.77886 type:complete len:214 (+) Transcript_31742:1014-1655(+)